MKNTKERPTLIMNQEALLDQMIEFYRRQRMMALGHLMETLNRMEVEAQTVEDLVLAD